MEKKTIGGFISALRKASGLTQKQLAEKLNVSDKAISRWERDEAMPDLSMIPELAEIFGVSTDEILRGERKNPEAAALPSKEKSEKQRKRILADKKTKYRIRSTISIGIGVLGVIAAAICNFGFLRAYIGFMVGAAFYAAAVICQVIFVLLNLSGLDEDLITEAELTVHREHTVKLACGSLAAVVTLLAFTLPLVIYPWDTYQGLNAGSWLLYGALYAAGGLVVCIVAACLADILMTKKGFLRADAKKKSLQDLRLRYMSINALVMVALLVGQLLIQSALPSALKQGIRFTDWESFKEYMETPAESDFHILYEENNTIVAESEIAEIPLPNDTVYYDDNGTLLDQEPPHKIYSTDGELLCEYYHRNENVSNWTYTLDKTEPNIVVYTAAEGIRVNRIMQNFVNPICICSYPLSVLIIYMIYRNKKKNLT